jgi:hypothetical protein
LAELLGEICNKTIAPNGYDCIAFLTSKGYYSQGDLYQKYCMRENTFERD